MVTESLRKVQQINYKIVVKQAFKANLYLNNDFLFGEGNFLCQYFTKLLFF